MKRISKYISLIMLFVGSATLFAQSGGKPPAQSKIDSLTNLLKTDAADSNKVKHLNLLSREYNKFGAYDTCILISNEALELASKINWKIGIANSRNQLGIFYKRKGDYNTSIDQLKKSLLIWEELAKDPDPTIAANGKKGTSKILGNIGGTYAFMGNFAQALLYDFKALQMDEASGNKNDIAINLSNIATVYNRQGNFEKAIDYYSRSIKIEKEIGDTYNMAINYSDISMVYYSKHDYTNALNFATEALRLEEEMGITNGIAIMLGNVGNIYADQKKYPEALSNFQKAVALAAAQGDKNALCINLGNIARLYGQTGKLRESEIYYTRSIALADSIGSLDVVVEMEQGLTEFYVRTKNYELAHIHYKNFIESRDALNSQENQKQQVQTEMNYEFDKKEAIATAIHKKELENQELLSNEKSRKQKIVIFFVVLGLLLVMIFAGFIFKSLRTTRKQKDIILVQKNIVEEQKAEVEQQKSIVEEHQREIIDSIMYARRIQRSLLPTEKYIDKNLKRLKKEN